MKKKKFLSMLMACSMVLGTVPATAWAADVVHGDITYTTEEVENYRATLTATCRGTACGCGETGKYVTLTLSTPSSRLYDTTVKSVSLGCDGVNVNDSDYVDENDWYALTGETSLPEIVYKQGENTLSGAPTNAGKYSASITVGENTLTLPYEVLQASISKIEVTTAFGDVVALKNSYDTDAELPLPSSAPVATVSGVNYGGYEIIEGGTLRWYTDEGRTTELSDWKTVNVGDILYWDYDHNNPNYYDLNSDYSYELQGKVTITVAQTPNLTGEVMVDTSINYGTAPNVEVTPSGVPQDNYKLYYQWFYNDGTPITEISEDPTYIPTKEDVGKDIYIVVTAKSADGKTAYSGQIDNESSYYKTVNKAYLPSSYVPDCNGNVTEGDAYPTATAVTLTGVNGEEVPCTLNWFTDYHATIPTTESDTFAYGNNGSVTLYYTVTPNGNYADWYYPLTYKSKYFKVSTSTPELTGTVTIDGITRYGQTLTAILENGPENVTLTYQWYRGAFTNPIEGATASTYTLTAEDIGSNVYVTITADGYNGEKKGYAYNISKELSPAAPANLEGIAPTTEGGNGYISGTTAEMEYSNNTSFSHWTEADVNNICYRCTGDSTEVAPGTYYVRMFETATRDAGMHAVVVVPEYSGTTEEPDGPQEPVLPQEKQPLTGAQFDFNAPNGLVADGTDKREIILECVDVLENDENEIGDTSVTFYDAAGNMVDEVKEAGTYTVKISAAEGTLYLATTEPIVLGTVTIAEEMAPVTSWLDCVEGEIPFRKAVNANSEKWIDRIDLPVFAVDFYNTLVEATDGDGTNDYLMDGDSFDPEKTPLDVLIVDDKETIISMKMTSVALNEKGIENEDMVADTLKDYLSAAYNAFDKDHPEVFWLTNNLNRSITSGYNEDNTYTVDAYMDVALYYNGQLDKNNDKRLSQFISPDNTLHVDGEYIGKPDDVTNVKDIAALSVNLAKGIVADFSKNLTGFEKHLKDNKLIAGSASLSGATFDKLTDAGKIAYFDYWLTANNNYNSEYYNNNNPESDVDGGLDAYSVRESISALLGKTGTYGPVCEAYARALKVLCDSQNIGCVLVEGIQGGPHLWNYVQVDDGKWYVVDTTQNEGGPAPEDADSLAGNENTDKLLVGRNTISEYIPENSGWSNISYPDSPAIQQHDFSFGDNWFLKSTGGSGNDSGNTSGGGGGSSSSSKTETTKNDDGSTTTIKTDKNGTVTTTETDASGNVKETVENTDGSKQTTVNNTDGSASVTTVAESGKVTAEVSLSEKAVEAAENTAVKLPVENVPVANNRTDAAEVTVKLPAGVSEAKVEVPLADATAGTVAIMVNPDGTETVIRDAVADNGAMALTVADGTTVKFVDNSKSFDDVADNDWYNSAVDFASSHQLFNGTTETSFSPNVTMTRGMLAVVLHNLENNPEGAESADFSDVGTDYYANAVDWAAEEGIISGYGDGNFGPNDSITREQLAVMLYRYAGSPATDTGLNFSDAAQINGYASKAVSWAVENGIISGRDTGELDPQGNATRAEVASMLMRFCKAN